MTFHFPTRRRPDPFANVVSFSIQRTRKTDVGGIRAQFLVGRDIMAALGWASGDRVEVGYGTPGSTEYGLALIRRAAGKSGKDGYRLRPRGSATNGGFQAAFLPEWILAAAHEASKCRWMRADAADAIIITLPAWAVKPQTTASEKADRPPAAEARHATADSQQTAQAGGSDSSGHPGAPPAAIQQQRSGAAHRPRRSEASGMGEDCGSHARETGVTRGSGSPAPVEPQTKGRMSGEAPAASDADPKQAGESPAAIHSRGERRVEAPPSEGPLPRQNAGQPELGTSPERPGTSMADQAASEGRDAPSGRTAAPIDRGSPDGDGQPKPSTATRPDLEDLRDDGASATTEAAAGRADGGDSLSGEPPAIAGSEPARGRQTEAAAAARPSADTRGGVAVPDTRRSPDGPKACFASVEHEFTVLRQIVYRELCRVADAGEVTPTGSDLSRLLGVHPSASTAQNSIQWLLKRGLIQSIGPKGTPAYLIVATGRRTKAFSPVDVPRPSAAAPLKVGDLPAAPSRHLSSPTKSVGLVPREPASVDSIVSYLRQSGRDAVQRVGGAYFIGSDGPLSPADLVEVANKRRLAERLTPFELAS